MVGIGPGSVADRTHRAEEAIRGSDLVIGYRPYLEHIDDLLDKQERIASGMREETTRCRLAIDEARGGRKVALVSSGDPGVYGMAGLVLSILEADGIALPLEIIPGISAASAAGALLGAPLMLDHAVISLSDLLVPWETIAGRLEAVFRADLVVALYNPKSRTRTAPWDGMLRLARSIRPAHTPVGVVRHAGGGAAETVCLTTLGDLHTAEVDMHTVVLLGNSTTRMHAGWLWTPRGYAV